MNKHLHNIYVNFFKNKLLIFILIIVGLLFVINQFYFLENFDPNENDKDKATNMGKWLGEKLVPPIPKDENIEEDAYDRIEYEFTNNDSKVPHEDARKDYNEKRKQYTSKEDGGSKDNPSLDDNKKKNELDREYIKYLYGNDSTQFNAKTNPEDKKRIFRFSELKQEEIPEKGDPYYRNIKNKDSFIDRFKKVLLNTKEKEEKDKLKDVSDKKKQFYNKAIDVGRDYIIANVNDEEYTGSTSTEGYSLIEGNTNNSTSCDVASSYNYNDNYWNGFFQAVNHKRGLDIPQVPRDDGTDDTDNVNPIKCYRKIQKGNPPTLQYKQPYTSCNECENRGYSVGQNIDIS